MNSESAGEGGPWQGSGEVRWQAEQGQPGWLGSRGRFLGHQKKIEVGAR